MDTTLAILSIAGAITLGAISPGPSFVMVARTAVASSRADGLAAALGMGVGGVIFAAAALLGLHVVLTAVPWLYLGLKVLGGAYLLFLGVGELERITQRAGNTDCLSVPCQARSGCADICRPEFHACHLWLYFRCGRARRDIDDRGGDRHLPGVTAGE